MTALDNTRKLRGLGQLWPVVCARVMDRTQRERLHLTHETATRFVIKQLQNRGNSSHWSCGWSRDMKLTFNSGNVFIQTTNSLATEIYCCLVSLPWKVNWIFIVINDWMMSRRWKIFRARSIHQILAIKFQFSQKTHSKCKWATIEGTKK